MDRGAWWAAVYGITQSLTRLKQLSSSSSSSKIRVPLVQHALSGPHSVMVHPGTPLVNLGNHGVQTTGESQQHEYQRACGTHLVPQVQNVQKAHLSWVQKCPLAGSHHLSLTLDRAEYQGLSTLQISQQQRHLRSA